MALEVGIQVHSVFNCAVVCLHTLGKLIDSHRWVSQGSAEGHSIGLENRLPPLPVVVFNSPLLPVAWVTSYTFQCQFPRLQGLRSPVAYSADFIWVFPGSGLGLFTLLPEGFCPSLHLPGRCPGTTNRQLWTLSPGHSREKGVSQHRRL